MEHEIGWIEGRITLADTDYWALGVAVSELCRQAGEHIAALYRQSRAPDVTLKADASPVTEADHQSQEILERGLRELTPEWPILSEEKALPPFAERRQWRHYWLVDPLDGTREYINRTGEFTVNIALIESGKPVLGVVGVPMESSVYLGVPGRGAIRLNRGEQRISVSALSDERVRLFTGSRHHGKKLARCIEQLQCYWPEVERLQAGSALKFCRLAEGLGDIYPRFSPCSEWDTAAGQALLEAAGGEVVDTGFNPLIYNQRESVSSPHFYALGCLTADWKAILATESD